MPELFSKLTERVFSIANRKSSFRSKIAESARFQANNYETEVLKHRIKDNEYQQRKTKSIADVITKMILKRLDTFQRSASLVDIEERQPVYPITDNIALEHMVRTVLQGGDPNDVRKLGETPTFKESRNVRVPVKLAVLFEVHANMLLNPDERYRIASLDLLQKITADDLKKHLPPEITKNADIIYEGLNVFILIKSPVGVDMLQYSPDVFNMTMLSGFLDMAASSDYLRGDRLDSVRDREREFYEEFWQHCTEWHSQGDVVLPFVIPIIRHGTSHTVLDGPDLEVPSHVDTYIYFSADKHLTLRQVENARK